MKNLNTFFKLFPFLFSLPLPLPQKGGMHSQHNNKVSFLILNIFFFISSSFGTIDIVDHFTYPGTNYIRDDEKALSTMIASNTRRTLTAVHLDGGGNPTPYVSNDTVLQMLVIPYLSNASCTTQEILYSADNPNEPLTITIPGGSYSDSADMIVPSHVRKDSRIYITYVDLADLHNISGDTCLRTILNTDGTINTSGALPGLSQCVNSAEEHYRPTFGQSAYNRCISGNGQPCTSTHQGSSCGTGTHQTTATCPDFNPIYDNRFGCLMCTLNIAPNCSSDNFAIRPKNFDVNIVNGDIFISGKPESLLFRGSDDNNVTPLEDYNEIQNSSFVVDLNVSNNAGCKVKSLTITPSVNFVNGEHNDTFIFNDIGDINMSIHETNGTEFAKVDVNDTPWVDRHITEYNATFTVIPDHFEVNTTLSDHNTDNNFTYISTDLNMSSTLDINITAQGEDNDTTVNYTGNCYAYPIDLNIALTYDYPMTPNTLSSILYLLKAKDSNYILDGNSSNINFIDNENDMDDLNQSIFPGGYHSGTAILSIKLNFDRKYNEVVNPFEMNITDINVTDDNDISNIVYDETGINAPDDNATYYYARAKSSNYFYDDETPHDANTPISVVVYHDPASSFELDILLFKPTNEYDWHLSTGHISNNDGNITMEALSGGSVNPADPNLVNISGGFNNSVSVLSSGGALPEDVNITFGSDTNTWMIFNPDLNEDEIPDPFYRVRFISTTGWAGHGDTGNVLNSDADTKTNKRLGW